MTDKLEKYINENRSSFDDLTPSVDLWNKISQNNKRTYGNKTKQIVYRVSGIAAIFIISLLSFTYFILPSYKQNSLSEFNKEIRETEQYYNYKVMAKKEKVYMLTSDQPEIKKDIETDLALLDTAMFELKKDLNENIANTEVVEAMIQNYRMKLQILEDILMYLEPSKKEENNSATSQI